MTARSEVRFPVDDGLVSLIDRFVVQLSQVFMLRVFLVGTIC
jgi:hypothetical protein